VGRVSFEVQRGELFVLLGPNGAGKVTLSRMLTTLIVPTLGTGLRRVVCVKFSKKVHRHAGAVRPRARSGAL
jgi:ABC-2 type transport system ATP-binding protein